ncbi:MULTISPECIES: DUF6894 family protein [unclassified Rhizobium]|uniref:DUF6894 family protein n=1 Tax=unclassified Rhizobium TaxID=2613769 RepID=UPI000DDD61F5|nr:hypothetical protein [Rhizobium sp. CNPSo 4062]MDK4700960.1 hypothetical protein [Rhizobium sp. CNPSo 4062]
MTTFYFATKDRETVLDDDEGQDLPDLISAVDEAKRILAEMALDGIPNKNGEYLAVEIARSDRISVVRLTLTMEITYLALKDDGT